MVRTASQRSERVGVESVESESSMETKTFRVPRLREEGKGER